MRLFNASSFGLRPRMNVNVNLLVEYKKHAKSQFKIILLLFNMRVNRKQWNDTDYYSFSYEINISNGIASN